MRKKTWHYTSRCCFAFGLVEPTYALQFIKENTHTQRQSLSPGIMDDLILKTRFSGESKGAQTWGIFPPQEIGHYQKIGRGGTLNPFSHNHGSGNLPQMKGNYCWREPFFTSMIMGGRARVNHD